jgi:5-methyltetrahydrofolate--homocysteine methyltransferase
MAQYIELKENVILGEDDKVKEIITTLLAAGNDPSEIMFEGLIRGMSEVGQKMKCGEMFIPEVLASAQAMRGGLEMVKPLVVKEKLSEIYIGKVVFGTVQGDLHGIGKNICSLMLQSEGFTVLDIGEDVPTEKFVAVVKEEKPNILGLSALMVNTMPVMKEVIDALEGSGLRDNVRVMVGGAPISQAFADKIGADGYAPDAVATIDKAKELLN